MTIKVCIGEYCHLKGAEEVVKNLQARISTGSDPHSVELVGCFCMNSCSENGVSVKVDGVRYRVTPDETNKFFDSNILQAERA